MVKNASIGYTTAVKCVLNPYYNPICGTDHKTYGNKDLLNCYNRQRPRQRQVRPMYHRECEPLICPSYQDLQGMWRSSVPVCANNGYTYGHIHQVRCLKDFMPNLQVLHEGGCTLYEVRKALGLNVKKKACAEKRITFEQNAICTTHNVTYANPFKALCAMRPRLREKIGGVCGCPFQRSCEKAHELQQSLRSAPIHERTKFVVCGSDWRTYRSQHHLECTRRYNSYLYMIHRGRCKQLEEPCPEKLKFIKAPTPVCGSDDKSYVSYEALICAQFRISKGLKYNHSGACVRKT
ncbi:serine protease inhibitor dipetalogastin-like [Bradysia coprophila]|uniref:serine protease inhibitor dipetalogastin-like n=1 Tax=Bradysia coprophila TaxID=38358 RepID=UPI00187D9F39|nr:serine protease inhibitor dipetalogastin-like [Bradysia coprophila]